MSQRKGGLGSGSGRGSRSVRLLLRFMTTQSSEAWLAASSRIISLEGKRAVGRGGQGAFGKSETLLGKGSRKHKNRGSRTQKIA